jgi:hypothetical protein
MATLNGPFSGDVKTPPGKSENANGNHYETSQLNQAPDGDIKPVFYDQSDALKGSPAALDTPNGTATSIIGNPFKK